MLHSVPGRAINRDMVEFWMGHVKGINAVGGPYDRSPEIYEAVLEKEYAKLEPYINIYSNPIGARTSDPVLAKIEQIMQVKEGREFFEHLVTKMDQETREWLRKIK